MLVITTRLGSNTLAYKSFFFHKTSHGGGVRGVSTNSGLIREVLAAQLKNGSMRYTQ